MGNGLEFACQFCGSPAVLLPETLSVTATVRCAACRAPIGSWLEYKAQISGAVRRSGKSVCADPMNFGSSSQPPFSLAQATSP